MFTLKEAWSKIVTAEDYEAHMAEIGQAQANAEIVRNFVLDLEVGPKQRLLFAGAGPGQMFDYIDEDTFGGAHIVFTDISESFLERLRARARNAGLTNFETAVDDVEDPHVKGPFDMAVLVLVLEHVDWRKALKALSGLDIARFLVVIQKNPEGMETAVSPQRTLRPSLQTASRGEQAKLLEEGDLTAYMSGLGYDVQMTDSEPVADGKVMCGFIFLCPGN